MHRIAFYTLFIAAAVIAVSCEKSKDFIKDEAVNNGDYLPVSTNSLVDMADNTAINNRAYSGGVTFRTELQYFSVSKVKEINLYATVGTGTRSRISNTPYAAAYSPIKKLDTLLVPYTVPTGLALNTSIKLDYEIVNENTKTLLRTATIKTK